MKDVNLADESIKKRNFILEFMHMNIGNTPTIAEVEVWAMGLCIAGYEVMFHLRDQDPESQGNVRQFFLTHQNLIKDALKMMEKDDKQRK